MAEPTCIHAVPQAADQLHGICIFCYRDRLGAARAENAALRERARRFYRADGTFDLLPNEEDVERKRIEAAKEIAALRERVAVLESKSPRKKPKAHAKLIEVASRALPLMTCCPECGGCNLRRAQSELREALAAAKPAAQEGKEAP